MAVGVLTVSADAQDRCGFVQVGFVGATGAAASDTTAPYTFASNPAPTASGTVTVTATAHDLGSHQTNADVTFAQVGTAL